MTLLACVCTNSCTRPQPKQRHLASCFLTQANAPSAHCIFTKAQFVQGMLNLK